MRRRNKKHLKYSPGLPAVSSVLRDTRSIFEHYNTDYFYNSMVPSGWKWNMMILDFTDQGSTVSAAIGHNSVNLAASPAYYSCTAEVCTPVTPTVHTDISSIQSVVDYLNSIPGKPAHILFRLHESTVGAYRMGIAVDYDKSKDFYIMVLDSNTETGNQFNREISNIGGTFTHIWDGNDLTSQYTKTIAI